MRAAALLGLLAVGTFAAVASQKSTSSSDGGYDYTAAIAPLRAAAVAKFQQAFNIDPNTALDPTAAAKAGAEIQTTIRTSWNQVDLRSLADMFSIRGTTLTANGAGAAGAAYGNAADAVRSLANAVEARNQKLGVPTTPAVSGRAGAGGAVHSPIARRRGVAFVGRRGRPWAA